MGLFKLSMGQNRVKGDFLNLRVVLHSFSTGIILIDEIKTNQLELWWKVKLSGPN